MNRLLPMLVLCAGGLLAFATAGAQTAFAQKQPDPPPVSISFRNDTNLTVIIQGYSVVKGMQRRGQPILVKDGKTSYDNNVPVGVRFITIVDYNQPNKVLLQDRIQLVPGRDLQLVIRPVPGNPNRVVLAQDQ